MNNCRALLADYYHAHDLALTLFLQEAEEADKEQAKTNKEAEGEEVDE